MENLTQLEARLAALSPERRRLLQAKLGLSVRQPGTARLSYAQQRIWFAHQVAPHSAAYNVPFDIPFSGELDEVAVRSALNELVRRHEGLRTVFPLSDGSPLQRILPPSPVTLPVLDFSALPAGWREATARRAAEQESRKPFDLAAGPLFRATLMRLGGERRVLACVLHHIICDGWSMSVLLDDFSELYLAVREGRRPELPPIAVQYRDYAEWQRQQGAPYFAADVAFWRERLKGLMHLTLPPDLVRRRSAAAAPGAGVEFSWPRELAAGLTDFSKAEGVTPFMVLVACLQWLLARYTEQTDVAVGADIAGRNRLETERLVGYFVNHVVLRTQLRPEWTFRELLGRVRETVLDAYAHQELPFDRLVDELAPRREAGRTPFFGVKLVVQNMPDARHSLEGMGGSHWQLGNYAAKLDVTLAVRLTPQSLGGVLEYAADLYSRERVEALLRHMQTLVAEAIAQPEQRLDALPLFDADESRRLAEWGRGPRRQTPDLCLHELFARQASLTPSAVALRGDGHAQSYAELEAQANQLAHYLARLGVGPEVRVGLYLPRSPDLFRSVLAVLKAGGAYVPLDPEYPRQRLADLIEDAQLAVVLTDSAHEASLPSSWAQVVCLDAESEAVAAEPTTTPVSGVSPANAAYVIYTSGSTGRPKGVVVPHAGVVNLAFSQIDVLGIEPGKVVAQFAPLVFDASVYEWTMALLSGATLAVGTAEALAPGEPLADFIELHAANVLTLPPSILARIPSGRMQTVDTLVVAGEACPQELVERWATGRRMRDAYGPTETSVCATISRPLEPHGRVSIGAPLQNLEVYLLDERMRQVPLGVPGDIYVAGAGLARGYLNRPAQTATAFLPNPFGAPGTRCYRTGDRGRWLPDGTIEFLGRSDEQVKINGCRIEPGEITSALLCHPRVREAAVNVNEHDGNASLAAYVVGKATATELREHLAGRLPGYMVPQRFVMLAALPLTPNGKLDRAALPEPQTATPASAYAAPSTPTEELLCRIWADVLGHERVGVRDNFFDLGGDSILSIQIGARAAEAGLALTTRDIFERQTVAELARAICSGVAAEGAVGEAGAGLPLTPIQEWFFGRGMRRPWHYNQAALLADAAPLDGPRLCRAVERVLASHEALRLRFLRDAHGRARAEFIPEQERVAARCGRVEFGGLPGWAASAALGAEAERVQRSLEPASGRTAAAVRAEGVGGGEGRGGRLLVVAHHLVIDGVSWRLLLDQVERAYAAASTNGAAAVTEPHLSGAYAAWARRLQAEAHSPETRAELPYWLAQHEAAQRPLPRDHERGRNTVGSAETVWVEFDERQTEALLREAPRRLRAQAEEVLLYGVAEALWSWAGVGAEAAVWCEGHGRGPLAGGEAGGAVGWLTALYPVRLARQTGAVGAVEGLRAVQAQLRAVPRRGLSYGLLRYVARAESLQGGVGCGVSFNYLGQWDANLGGLFRGAGEGVGAGEWEGEERAALVEVHGSASGGRVRMGWTYGREVYERATVEGLAGRFRAAVETIIAAASRSQSPVAADFPLAKLDDERLKGVLARMARGRQRPN